MKLDPVASAVREFISDNFLVGQDPAKFSDTASLMGEGIMDSTGILELIGFLEKTYEISVRDEELTVENLDSVGSIAAFVARKQGEGSSLAGY